MRTKILWIIFVLMINCSKNVPTVTITNPVDGDTVSGTVDITAEASDAEGVSHVNFYIDDSLEATVDHGDTAYIYSWYTADLADSTAHEIYARAFDNDNNTATSETITVIVVNYGVPPIVAITNPVDSTVVTGTVDITADATDNISVTRVDFFINDTLRGTVNATPYIYQWGTHYTPDSTYHTIYAIAYDADSLFTSSETIMVMVDNSSVAHNTLRLLSAVINSETLSVSDPQITVQVNGSISGQVELQAVNLGESGWVAPLAGTPSWGSHSTAYWGIDSWIPAGTNNFTTGISLTAPANTGLYYIYFAWGHEMGYDDVMSLTSWQYSGGPTWNDGADVADWNDGQAQECIAKGYVFTNYRWSSGDYGLIYLAGAAIRVTVNP